MGRKAFVSSTIKDLKDHRSHVITSLRSAGVFVDPMGTGAPRLTNPNSSPRIGSRTATFASFSSASDGDMCPPGKH